MSIGLNSHFEDTEEKSTAWQPGRPAAWPSCGLAAELPSPLSTEPSASFAASLSGRFVSGATLPPQPPIAYAPGNFLRSLFRLPGPEGRARASSRISAALPPFPTGAGETFQISSAY